ncbi:GTPase [Pengzhenrongella frigida]|uniref:ABC transporter n=1 Tax=Pengzhenrongella frigida TaxID=1259133 RepID=A0A4Q5N7B7_9MICO|nr:GTPase [Cellulomonas sp. HLT2-17]RYV52361.1 ABC transporter [Cellulomonas sp. HLT2-17]
MTAPTGWSGRGAHRSETADLTDRVEALERALVVADGRLPRGVTHKVSASIDRVRERLALGVDHTIVALVGGTGSGKSSLFNAISGLTFADVGVRRPTTSQVTACVWGSSGDPLLDWLGVQPDRRIQRESALDADAQAALRGLVLLDLPDHDSIEPTHRDIVDQFLPMVDLLVWVVDPQKYADDALHSGYLSRLVGHEAAMVVVLNQIDTVRPEARTRLEADVARLLREDGLTGVRIQSASARTGDGVVALRQLLAEVAARRSTAAVRAGAEVTDAATLLSAQVAPSEPSRDELPVTAVVESFSQAVGLPVIADALEAAVRGRGGAVPAFGSVHQDTVELARARWLGDVGEGLPVRWQRALAARVATNAELRQAVDARMVAVGIAARRSRGAIVLAVAAVAAVIGALATGSVALGARVGADSDWISGLVVAGALLGLAVVLVVSAVLVRRRDARRRATVVRRDGRAALGEIVEARLVQPTLALLGEHREVRGLAAGAATFAPTAGPSTGETAATASPT